MDLLSVTEDLVITIAGKQLVIVDPNFADMVFDIQQAHRKRFRKKCTQRQATKMILDAFKERGLNIYEIIEK